MYLGMGVDRRAWVGVCMHGCVWVRGLFLDFGLLKGALCAAISLWDSGIGSGAPETKQFVHFLEGSVNKCLSHSHWPMSREEKRGFRYVHNYGHGQIQNICVTRLSSVAFLHLILFSIISSLYLHFVTVLLFCSLLLAPPSTIISLRRCHSPGYTVYPLSDQKKHNGHLRYDWRQWREE